VVVVVVVAVVRLAASLVWLLLLHQQGHVAVACLKEVEQVGHRGVVRLWHNRQRAAGRTRQVERGGISITLYVLSRNQQDTLLVESAVQSRKQHVDRPTAATDTGTLTLADTGDLTAHGVEDIVTVITPWQASRVIPGPELWHSSTQFHPAAVPATHQCWQVPHPELTHAHWPCPGLCQAHHCQQLLHQDQPHQV